MASRRIRRPNPKLWPLGPDRPTLGPIVCEWIRQNLVHAEGDYVGTLFQLRPWQEEIIHQCYELVPEGRNARRRYDRVLIGLPKGNGKTELAAALAIAEFAGPVVFAGFDDAGNPVARPRTSPDIPVAAASFEQADLVFGACRTMIRQGKLRDYCEVYDTEILLRDLPGRLYRVPAVAGTNDGVRPTFFVADELHEWTGNKERVYLVLSNGRAKRSDSWQLAITTAGWDTTSLLGRLYSHGSRVAAGEVSDPGFLFIWREASRTWNLEDDEQLRAAIREANPAADDFLPVENVVRAFRSVPEHEGRRYFLNQWVAAPDRWMEVPMWMGCAEPGRTVEPGTPIVLGFDGSYSRDSTALVGCTLEDRPHLFVLGCWERPPQAREWTVSREEVIRAIDSAIAKYQVQRLGYDDTFGAIWQLDMLDLAAKGIEIVQWPTRSQARMAPAAAAFHAAVRDRLLTHDGDARMLQHVGYCTAKPTRYGTVPTKESQDSERHIDLAIAAIIAYDLALRTTAVPALRWVPIE